MVGNNDNWMSRVPFSMDLLKKRYTSLNPLDLRHQQTEQRVEHGVYVNLTGTGELTLICLYVDDLVIIGSNEAEILKLKGELKSEFEMTNLGELAYFLGIEFLKTPRGIIMHQRKYITDVLERFQMMNCKPASVLVEGNQKPSEVEPEMLADATLYRQMVGCLRFICHSRPEITYGVGVISKYMASPTQSHMVAAKRILRYLKGTSNYGVLFPNQNQKCESSFVGFSDSDWCGDKEDRRSTSGYVFTIFGAPVSWNSRKQDVVALSTCEAEYIAACNAICQGLWLIHLMTELRYGEFEDFELRVDNQSTINLAKNLVRHGRSKHIETRFHFLRDQVGKGRVKMVHCSIDLKKADVITKALKVDKFNRFRDMLNVHSFGDKFV
ncbi:PREDICTED: uncharacterized protein LOC109341799 [Lupinus angustifolius]|uniref:uncharacterized protein LOC109341799 n=1 Tax=Lupinus angustifolius TaxID=3871 RepID=UPI00092E86BD|nr:PREDICTED: uncharacterized protein LOC109341799 [Lupinus angustifolius]